MKFHLNLLLISMISLPLSRIWIHAKSIDHVVVQDTINNDSQNATKQQQNSSDTTTNTVAIQKDNDNKPIPTVLRHIVRRRETAPDLPFNFHVNHLPCDLDSSLKVKLIGHFPNHCIWIYNNRYIHEGYYRTYKIYQLEAFFFGQYYERLKRYEMDPHSFDYSVQKT